uniref:Uncharacterized protein n=1 Tax=Cacopsylla melanoneura TaxID=428564 RepID=A0A8D8ZDY6_9HEMI
MAYTTSFSFFLVPHFSLFSLFLLSLFHPISHSPLFSASLCLFLSPPPSLSIFLSASALLHHFSFSSLHSRFRSLSNILFFSISSDWQMSQTPRRHRLFGVIQGVLCPIRTNLHPRDLAGIRKHIHSIYISVM